MADTVPVSCLNSPDSLSSGNMWNSQYDVMNPIPIVYGRDGFMQAIQDGDGIRVANCIMQADKFHPFFLCDLDDALAEAAARGHYHIVRTLVDAGATLDSFKFCASRDKDIAMPWFEERCPREKPCECRGTALQEASAIGRQSIVSFLLKNGADPNFTPIPHDGKTALQGASGVGHAGIGISLRAGSTRERAEPVAYLGRTALQAAAAAGHSEIVATLLTKGAYVNAKPAYDFGRTALQAAAEGGHTEIVESLLTAGAKVNAKPASYGGRTALQAAAAGGHEVIVTRLLRAGADVNAKPAVKDGRTALQAAADGGHAEIFASLLTAKADPNAEPAKRGGKTALQAAAKGGHTDIVARLLTVGAKVNAPPANRGKTALQAAAAAGHSEIVATLLMARADVNAQPDYNFGRTALQAAAEGGHTEIVESLLTAGAKVNAEPASYGGKTALQAAAGGGHAELVMSLSTVGATVNAGPAHFFGRTALQAAAESGHADIVESLLTAGAKVNAEPAPYGGRTALQAAAEGGHAEIVASLLTAGADINAEPAPERFGRTALQAAADRGHEEIVASLLTSGAHVNAEPAYHSGRTALQAAAEGGHAEIVASLLAAGADINAEPASVGGRTAFQAAAEDGHAEVLNRLLAAARDVNTQQDNPPDINKYSECLIYGITRPRIVQTLLQAGMKPSVLAPDGSTLLHCAVRQRNLRSAALLLLAGVDTASQDQDNLTPLDAVPQFEGGLQTDLLRIFLWFGCVIRGCRIKLWREAYHQFPEKGFLTITARPIPNSSRVILGLDRRSDPAGDDQVQSAKSGKTSIRITSSDELPQVEWGDRKCFHHSATDVEELLRKPRQIVIDTYTREFYAVVDVPSEKKVICMRKWRWCRVMNQSESNDQAGTNLPSHLKMDTTDVAGAFLICSVSFDYLLHITGQGQKTDDMAKAFRVAAKKGTVSWIMQKAGTKKKQELKPILRTIDFVGTLDIGWVPDDAVDFFNSYVVDLHRKWRVLIEEAGTHLDNSRKILLKKQGKSAGFIEVLLVDAQTWSDSRILLQTQVLTAKDILKEFSETKYLQDEIFDPQAALGTLSGTIDQMEAEVMKEIDDLDDKTQKLIELEFNLVSIYESRTTKEMGMSMKRLSWITFIFLPLMFVTSLFGMNIDLLNGGPNWKWVILLAGLLFTVDILAWCLLKRFPIDEWIREKREEVNTANLKGNTSRKWYEWGFWRKEASQEDLESGEAFEFTRPQRRWAKELKDH